MANTNETINIFAFESATAETKQVIMNQSAGGFSFDTEVPFKITGFDVVNGHEIKYENGSEVSNNITTRRPMIVLKTSQDVNIFLSQIKKNYVDINNVVHHCGGAVFDGWRAVKRNGKTNEQYVKDLIAVTADESGNQRELIASYNTINWINPRDTNKQVTEKAILSINFK